MPSPPRRLRRVALALVGGPIVAAGILLIAELVARVATPADSPCALPCYFERRAIDGRDALVPSPRPPMASARFWPASIPIEKPAGTRRIVCLGDSTVHGHPFEPPAAFPDWLAARLPKLLPGSAFEVFNLGANGMGSEEVLDLVRELAPLRPDAVVVYVGHNELLENGADAVRRPASHALARLADRSCLLRRLLPKREAPAPPPPAAKALIDDEPLFAPEQIARSQERYRDHLRAIAREIEGMGATPVLCVPVCDLLDTPPERSCFAAATPPADREQVRTELAKLRGRRLELEQSAVDPNADERFRIAARSYAARAMEIARVDLGVAAVEYERGRLLRLGGDAKAAHEALVRARDLDAHPIRAPGPLLDVVRAVTSETGAVLVDPWPLIERAAPDGLAGQAGLFVDYVHPDLAGHRVLADAILLALAARGVFAEQSSWRFGGEPTIAEYEAAMGFSRAKLADSLARRGMFALGQGYLSPDATEALRAADDLFDTALSVSAECALAHAGRGALALVKGESERALAELDRARELDPASLATLIENHEKVPAVRQLFEKAGLVLRDGRFVRQ